VCVAGNSYDGHERENVVLEVVPVISSHLDVDGDEYFDVSLNRVRPFPSPPPPPPPPITAAAAAAVSADDANVRSLS